MRTIPRNRTKEIAEIRAKGLPIRAYTRDRDFIAFEPRDPEYPWRLVEQGRGQLIDWEDGRYTIRVNGNEWFELGER